MGTMTFTIASPAGTRTKAFTFPDSASSAIMTAAQNLYPSPTVGEALDAWFQAHMDRMVDEVRSNQKQVASAAAVAGVANIPIT